MNGYSSENDHQPVTWLRGYPLFAAHFIVGVLVVSMIATTIVMAANAGQLLDRLAFSSTLVMHGQIWRVFTYGLVNPPSLWFAIDMLMIVWFGREVERFFGRRTFLTLYACIYLLPPLLFTLIGLWRPMEQAGETGAFALFIAFATLYPNAMMLFNLLAKWVAWILVGLYTLMAFSSRNLIGLVSLWSTVGFAYLFVRYHQGHFTLPAFRFPRRSPKLRVLPDLVAKKVPRQNTARDTSMAEVDALLDKIATSGIASLTSKERAKLDAARAELLKKSSGLR